MKTKLMTTCFVVAVLAIGSAAQASSIVAYSNMNHAASQGDYTYTPYSLAFHAHHFRHMGQAVDIASSGYLDTVTFRLRNFNVDSFVGGQRVETLKNAEFTGRVYTVSSGGYNMNYAWNPYIPNKVGTATPGGPSADGNFPLGWTATYDGLRKYEQLGVVNDETWLYGADWYTYGDLKKAVANDPLNPPSTSLPTYTQARHYTQIAEVKSVVTAVGKNQVGDSSVGFDVTFDFSQLNMLLADNGNSYDYAFSVGVDVPWGHDTLLASGGETSGRGLVNVAFGDRGNLNLPAAEIGGFSGASMAFDQSWKADMGTRKVWDDIQNGNGDIIGWSDSGLTYPSDGRLGKFTEQADWSAAVTPIFSVTVAPVPEPGTLALVLTAGLGLLCYAWRRRRS